MAEPVPATTLEAQLKKELWEVLAAQRPSQTWLDEAPIALASAAAPQEVANIREPAAVPGREN